MPLNYAPFVSESDYLFYFFFLFQGTLDENYFNKSSAYIYNILSCESFL